MLTMKDVSRQSVLVAADSLSRRLTSSGLEFDLLVMLLFCDLQTHGMGKQPAVYVSRGKLVRNYGKFGHFFSGKIFYSCANYHISKQSELILFCCFYFVQMQEVRVSLPNVVHVVRIYSVSGKRDWYAA